MARRHKQKDDLIGLELDGYEIQTLLGRGGMARVYRGLDIALNRYAAIKVIDSRGEDDVDYEGRFKLEARAIAQLHHPNIVGIYRFGQHDGVYYMAMHYIDGGDLGQVIKAYLAKNQLIAHKEIENIISQIASGLDYAHSKGVIHRDIKPSNIMLDKTGKVATITDFGLALMQSEGTRGNIFGSPHYVAPEQAISSAGVVPQSDIYSLGVMLYQMLTGNVPFNDETPMQIAMAHMSKPLPHPQDINPNLPDVFVPILTKALEKDPKNRYATAKALGDDLKQAVKQARQESGSRNAVNKPRPAPQAKSSTSPVSKLSVAEIVDEHRKNNPLPPPSRSKPLDVDATKVLPSKQLPKQDERNSSSRKLIAMLLLVLLVVGGAIVATQTDLLSGSDDAPTISTISLSGRVNAIEDNRITLYDLEVELNGQDDLLDALSVGDFVQLEGHHTEQDERVHMDSLAVAMINGVAFSVD